ncbi:MAG TPA: serine hydrolase domain-containing protein [Usitatibacter sp.]|nr:serine hydrolase domain-containing protein [Usitatibacter sp.]
MKFFAALGFVLWAASLPAFADMQARQVFESWLDAFNSDDTAKQSAFDAAHSPPRPFATFQRTRFFTGGLTLVRYEKEEPTTVVALLQENNADTVARATLSLADEQGGKVSVLDFRIVPRPDDLAIRRMPIEEAAALAAQRMDLLAKKDLFAGVALVARGDKVILERAVGYSDREVKRPNTIDTQFRIGSMNKMFTSVAILQLVGRDKLSLDDTVGKYIPDYPAKDVATKVRIRHLLTHTGGTGDIFGPDFVKHRMELRTLDDYYRLYGARALDVEPGYEFRYSNYGYILLGLIIEKVSGMSYYDYVRENIFAPAGMTATDSLPETESVPQRSVGYMRRGAEWKPNTDTLPWRGTSAGGGYSTARDLLKFALALQSGKLLAKEKVAEASRPQFGLYGFGFVTGGKGALEHYGHGGGAPGMNGELRIYPESGLVIVVLSNLDPPAATNIANFLDLRISGR